MNHRRGVTFASVSRRVNSERLVLLGWSRAILLQLAHPLVAAGVHAHSSVRATPWAAAVRLRQTVRAMLALSFGDEAGRERAVEGIRTIHRHVHGHLTSDVGPFPAGTRYSAEDPALVLWVHATLLEAVPLFYELLVAPLSPADRDEYCAEAASVAVALGARDQDVPRSWGAARDHIEREYASGRIVVGPQARELAGAVLSPPIRVFAAPATRINRVLTLGLLPPSIRRQYGFDWTARDERTLARIVGMIRTVRPRLPDALAIWPDARRDGR